MMSKNLPLYRALLLSTILLAGTDALAKSSPGDSFKVLTTFEEKNVAQKWKTVNDNVMGGRSKGAPTFDKGILTFSGATNTNGGGFSSIRTETGDYDLTGKTGLLIRARGDGRTFKAELRTDVTNGRWSVPFRADFKTVKGEWREFYLPIKSFTPTFFGRTLRNPPALDPSKVRSIGFMIYDKNDGAFMLEVDWVKAVDKNRTTIAKTQPGTIVDQAIKDGRFSILAAALNKANLVGVLQGDGPFTVFAPTDKAFSKLPKGTVAELLKPENREKLEAVLKYHVSAGAVGLGRALDVGTAKTLEGSSLSIAFGGGRVKVNNASILDANINCPNGVIHVIDTVLLPPTPKNDIPSVAKRAGTFTALLAAVNAAGLEETLGTKGPFTILAPTDEAFNSLPKGTIQELLKKENLDKLKTILAYHVISGKVGAGDALNARKANTLNGMPVTFGIEDGLLKVNNATIRKTDIECDNGVIHVIDTVLLPPSADNTQQQKQNATTTTMSPVERIEYAIERGVLVFNNGQPGKCAAIYEECLVGLTKDKEIDAALSTAIKRLLEYGADKGAVERAWIYRDGLNRTLQSGIGS